MKPKRNPQQRKAKVKKARGSTRPTTTYKVWCDNHPSERAAYSFIEASTGELRGLCQDCFDEEREESMRRLARRERIKKARARRK